MSKRAEAVIEALRGLQLGDEVEMLPYGNTGEIIGISEYSGSFQVYAPRTVHPQRAAPCLSGRRLRARS